MSHRRKNVSVARVVYNWLCLHNIFVPHLLQRDEQSIGVFVDLIVRKTFIGIVLVCLRAPSAGCSS